MKLKYLVAVLAVLAAPLLVPALVGAGGSTNVNYSNFSLSASKSSVTANGTDSIKFTISFFNYKCVNNATRIQASGCDSEGGVAGKEAVYCSTANCQKATYAHAKVSVSGSGNTLSSSIVYPDASGIGTFTLKSKAAGSKTVKLSNEAPSASYAETSKTVTFVAVPTTVPKKTTTPTTAPKTTPKPVSAPKTPKLASVTIDNKAVDTNKPVEVAQNKPLVLGGKTVANGTVTLFIFSDPKTATVKADKDGNWAYSVTDLEPGDHHIESQVTDPASGKSSTRESVLAFTVKAVAAPAATTPQVTPAKNSNSLLFMVGGGVVLLAAAGGGFWWRRKRKHTPSAGAPVGAQDKPTETPATPEAPDMPPSEEPKSPEEPQNKG
jgi:LPXTG-motif cell wall-anchored protein